VISSAKAIWHGRFPEGEGEMKTGSGAFEGAYSFKSRFEGNDATNPEELIGAASAGCFAMALSALLSQNGFPPESLEVGAKVELLKRDAGFEIAKIELSLDAKIPEIDEAKFLEFAKTAKANCPVSKALAGVPISLTAKLV